MTPSEPIKNTTYTIRSAFYLDLHLKTDTESRLRTTVYDKVDDFNVPMGNFPFKCTNIPTAPVYGDYGFQLKRYSRAFDYYQNFLDKVLLLTRKSVNDL